MSKTLQFVICPIVCLLLGLPSCIKDDLTNCPPVEQSLQVIFSCEDAAVPESQPELQNATLFVFDKNDVFVTSWRLDASHPERPSLNKMYVPDFKLLPGEYHFVVWFDLLPPYSITPAVSGFLRGTTRIDQAAFQLEIPGNRTIETPLPRLLYGYKSGEIKTRSENILAIPVTQQTNTVNIVVTGLPPTTDEYLFRITDTNGNYTFLNAFADCEAFSYTDVNRISTASQTLTGSLTVLKLAENRPTPLLVIQNQTTGKQVFPRDNGADEQGNLIEIIRREHPGNDFDRTHTYTIHIDIDDTNVTVNVSVGGWNEKPSDNELSPTY